MCEERTGRKKEKTERIQKLRRPVFEWTEEQGKLLRSQLRDNCVGVVGWRGGLVWVTLVWVGGVISQVSQALSRSRSGSRAGSDVPLGLDFCRLAFFFSSPQVQIRRSRMRRRGYKARGD